MDKVSNPLLPGDESEAVGLIKENGDINWDCPCLQGMGSGPCGEQFKDAFSCFHYSESEPKGSDCLQQFQDMQECFLKKPEVYGSLDDDLKDDEDAENENDIKITGTEDDNSGKEINSPELSVTPSDGTTSEITK